MRALRKAPQLVKNSVSFSRVACHRYVTRCAMQPAVDEYQMGASSLLIKRAVLHNKIRCAFLNRMRKAVPENEQGVALLQGGSAANFYSSDTELPYRQEPYFQYLFGVDEDGCYGAVDVKTGHTTLFVPKLPDAYAVWMGPLKTLDDIKAKYGVDEVKYVDSLKDSLEAMKPTCLHVLSGTDTDSGISVKGASFDGMDVFKVDSNYLWAVLTKCRVYKHPEELEIMRYANEVGSRAHVAMMQACKPGLYEYQMESVFLHTSFMTGGCKDAFYSSIAAAGSSGAVLHYITNDKPIKDGDMMLMDMGCMYYSYGSDITTSCPANGKFTADQKLVYNAVLAAQVAVKSALKPGVAWPDMHTLAYRTILTHLRDGGVITGDVEEMLAAEVGGLFMPHGLGHLIGLHVHDVGGYMKDTPARIMRPGYKSLRTARMLEEGMTITVEPGCYFNKALLLPALEDPKYSKFLVRERILQLIDFGGVRIEDNVVITKDGMESFTNVPRTVEEVEAVMAGQPWPLPSQ